MESIVKVIEIKVRPIIRYAVTSYTGYIDETVGASGGGSSVYGELDSLAQANRVAEAMLAKEIVDNPEAKVTLIPIETHGSVDYKNMSSGEMVAAVGDDAAKWADAFCQIFPGSDWGLMIGWFANAIEVSHDIRLAKKKHYEAIATLMS